jgi:hypothetical protein
VLDDANALGHRVRPECHEGRNATSTLAATHNKAMYTRSYSMDEPVLTQRESPMRFTGWQYMPSPQRLSAALAAVACSSAVSRSSVSGLIRRAGMSSQ